MCYTTGIIVAILVFCLQPYFMGALLLFIFRQHGLPLLAAGLIIIVSTLMQWATLWAYGGYVLGDSDVFLTVTYNLYQGQGFVFHSYNLASESVVAVPMAHWPPLIPVMYSLPLWFGVPLPMAPSIILLILWPAFLVGMGWLGYRLSQSMGAMVWTVLLAAVASPFLYVFGAVWSEPAFITLLVFAMAIFTNLPQQTENVTWRLISGIVLLALLLLTRYPAMFLYAGVVVWWIGWRWYQQRYAALWRELVLFGLGGVPFALWLARNVVVSGHLFGGGHIDTSQDTFVDGFVAVLQQSVGILLLVPEHGYLRDAFSLASMVLSRGGLAIIVGLLWLALFGTIGYTLHRHNIPVLASLASLQSPVVVLLAVYIGLYTLVQPFATFTPMDVRDFTTVLCLALPWLLALLVCLPKQTRQRMLFGYVSLNMIMLVVLLAGRLVAPPPDPRLNATSGSGPVYYFNVFNQYAHIPTRAHDLPRFHPELAQHLQQFETPPLVISNTDLLLAPYPEMVVKWGGATDQSLLLWLQEGACQAQSETVIVIFDWYRWEADVWLDWQSGQWFLYNQEGPTAFIERKCPHLEKIVLDNNIIYHPGNW